MTSKIFNNLISEVICAILYLSHRVTQVQHARVFHKGVNIRKRGSLETNLEAGYLREAFVSFFLSFSKSLSPSDYSSAVFLRYDLISNVIVFLKRGIDADGRSLGDCILKGTGGTRLNMLACPPTQPYREMESKPLGKPIF